MRSTTMFMSTVHFEAGGSESQSLGLQTSAHGGSCYDAKNSCVDIWAQAGAQVLKPEEECGFQSPSSSLTRTVTLLFLVPQHKSPQAQVYRPRLSEFLPQVLKHNIDIPYMPLYVYTSNSPTCRMTAATNPVFTLELWSWGICSLRVHYTSC